jgi:hypothetical protein
MSRIATATFEGASGKNYDFNVYPIHQKFLSIGAVYVFTKRTITNGDGTHDLIYIGETDNLETRIPNHEKWPCIKRNNANCICIHADDNETSRLNKETDLRNAHDTPCNDQ